MSDACANQFNHGSNGYHGRTFVTEAVAAASLQGCEVERDRSLPAVARTRWRNKRPCRPIFLLRRRTPLGPTFAQGYGAAGSRRYTESAKSADLSAFSVFSALN